MKGVLSGLTKFLVFFPRFHSKHTAKYTVSKGWALKQAAVHTHELLSFNLLLLLLKKFHVIVTLKMK